MDKIVSDDALLQTFHSMKEKFVTSKDVRDIVIETNQGTAFVKRNTPYNVGDLTYSSALSRGLLLECIKNGTTGKTDPVI